METYCLHSFMERSGQSSSLVKSHSADLKMSKTGSPIPPDDRQGGKRLYLTLCVVKIEETNGEEKISKQPLWPQQMGNNSHHSLNFLELKKASDNNICSKCDPCSLA